MPTPRIPANFCAYAYACAIASGCHGSASPAADTIPASSSSGAGDTGVVEDPTTGADTSGDLEVTGASSSESTGEAPPPILPGLFAEYYAGYSTRVLAQVEPAIDIDWGDGAPAPELEADRFSVRWTGWLTPEASGVHTIITDTDDGVRLWIDGALRIDDWTPHFVTRNTVDVDLTADVPVAIVVEYFEIDLAASVRLSWSSATMPEQPIAAAHFTTQEPETPGDRVAAPYLNPMFHHDGLLVDAVALRCADPGVIAVPDAAMPGYYAVCTGGSFPIRHSPDLVFWRDTDAALLPGGKASWSSDGGRNWAPEIHRVGDRFVAYFTANDGQGRLAIGTAVANDVVGPWAETDAPLVTDPLGVIDATYVEADGVGWLAYKPDGNAHGVPTPILLRQLAADGLSFAPGGAPAQLITNDLGWEGGVIEAPWFVAHDGMFYLFYAGNVYDHRYRTGVARASSVTGPYEKHGDPILVNNERWVGPGHGSVVRSGDDDIFVYHAWTNAGGGNDQDAGRQMLVDRIVWDGGWPRIHDGSPSRTWQPAP
jgi:GH43 family beta-xylosidase